MYKVKKFYDEESLISFVNSDKFKNCKIIQITSVSVTPPQHYLWYIEK